jgi:hypothetical protein
LKNGIVGLLEHLLQTFMRFGLGNAANQREKRSPALATGAWFERSVEGKRSPDW